MCVTTSNSSRRASLQLTKLRWLVALTILAIQLFVISGVHAWVPPMTKDGRIDPDFESVHAMRKRLGISYNYTPSLLHPELCRYVTESECQHVEESLRRHAQTHIQHVANNRKLQQQMQQQMRRREQGQADYTQINADHNPNLGKIKVLVLMIQFPDHSGRNLISRDDVEALWKGEIANWFQVNSQGLYAIEPVVIDWVVTDKTEKEYANGQRGITIDLAQAMVPALDKLDNDPDWDWSSFDSDQDGFLDSVAMMHSGISAVVTPDPDCFGQEQNDRIWPHAWANTGNTWTNKDDSLRLNGYVVASVFDGICDDAVMLTPGLTCHEYMHTMGLVDLYDFDYETPGKGTGAWDIMSHPYGADNSGTPGLLSTWSKVAAEWITPILIDGDGIYTAKPAHESSQVYKIDISPDFAFQDEYLLIENRQPIGFEENLWGKGLVIVHVDDLAILQTTKGWPGQPGWPENGNHYQVAVLPKDGRYDLEQNENYGDAGDLFDVGDSLGPGMGNTIFPNTDSYQGGFIIETGITVTVLSQEGNDIIFEVSGTGKLQDTSPETTASPTNSPDTEGNSPPTSPPIALPTDSPQSEEGNDADDPNAYSNGSYNDRWILSRPPVPTRAPFTLPEFEVEKPLIQADGTVGTLLSSDTTSGTDRRSLPLLLTIVISIVVGLRGLV